jgi:hypothetical protein
LRQEQGSFPLLATLQGADADVEGRDALTRCGFKRPSVLLRLRVLDPVLRQHFGGLCEICAGVDELAQMVLPASRILVVENLQSALALPDLPQTIAFASLGKGVGLLAHIPWVRSASIDYWGDIDTHLPPRERDRPDRDRLALRFEQFKAAS